MAAVFIYTNYSGKIELEKFVEGFQLNNSHLFKLSFPNFGVEQIVFFFNL